ncbi:helix-turn-helix domain-containing protein [Nocardioides sp.]|uniref:PucR family transcriptional regulator n=1 Tax=Nocardioides sp. TaxID=35761 RepID=UPI0026258DCF|nr:helix-turn-helix domain-containing protein [Nocardioides sp.]
MAAEAQTSDAGTPRRRGITRHLATALRPAILDAVEVVRASIPGLECATGSPEHRLMQQGANVTLQILTMPTKDRALQWDGAAGFFGRLGWIAAEQHRSPKLLHLAVTHGALATYRELVRDGAERSASVTSTDMLEQLLRLGERLSTELQTGYDLRVKSSPTEYAALWAGLSDTDPQRHLEPRRGSALAALAHASAWPMPSRCAVISTDDAAAAGFLTRHPATLAGPPDRWQTFLVDAEVQDAVVTEAAQHFPGVTLLQGWDCPHDKVHLALRWAHRLAAMVEARILPGGSVVHCSDDPLQFWLRADLSVRERLVQDVLDPLLALRGTARINLAETLLDWLQVGGPAAQSAARLGVHVQTVRNRRQRLRTMFGEATLEGPRRPLLTAVLQATVPLWLAGDEHDFRSHAERGPG